MRHYVGLGRVIKKSRIERGLSQKEIGEIAGVCRTAVINLEKGRRVPKWDKMIRISRVLDVDLGPFM